MFFLGRISGLVGGNWNWNEGQFALFWIKFSLVSIASLPLERHHLFSGVLQSSTRQWMDKLFMSNGFRVDMISYEDVARNLGKQLASEQYKNILFVAEQLRFSDDQVRQLVSHYNSSRFIAEQLWFWWSDEEKQSKFSSLSFCEMSYYF